VSDQIIDQAEEELLSLEISDEMLETAGTNDKAGAYTLYACTGLSTCPD
jgi:hypothetical protein